ncbi:MAG: hypothetical protein LC099_01490 [Anaerolineales bacterium]|nr:hypothetical protein [Anaerolineales bacterium]
MRRGRNLIIILLIVIVALVVMFVAFRSLFAPQPTAVEDQTVYTNVYYAAQNIPLGGRITEETLATFRIPQENVASVMFTEEELPFLVDKIAKMPLDQGTMITEAMVTDSAANVEVSGPQWAALIPPSMTAMSIPVDRVAISAYSINKGAHVNVNTCLLFVDVDPTYQSMLPNLTAVVTAAGSTGDGLPVLSLGVAGASPQGRFEMDQSVQQPHYVIPSEGQRPRPVCQTVLQDVVVLGLGDFPLSGVDPATQPAEQQPAQEGQEAPPPAPMDLVTLIVTPQDSITLSYLRYTKAQITLTLRNPSDQARIATEAATMQFLLSQYNIPVPGKLPYAFQLRIDPTLSNFSSSE